MLFNNYTHLPLKIKEFKQLYMQKEVGKLRIYTAILVLCITFAELLIFFRKTEIALWMHIITLVIFYIVYIFTKNPEAYKICQALTLLPILRLINLSMPIFFKNTLYTFICSYGTLAIPVIILIVRQKCSFEQISISMKNAAVYTILSISLGFFLGLGEYLIIQPGYLIPDITFINLLKLSIVMVLFVGLVEEAIFRSITQTRLQEALSIKEVLIITSILFGFMHSGYSTFNEILYAGFVGFIMGVGFYKTRSLPFMAVLHGFINVFLFGIFPHYLNIWKFFQII